MQELLLPRRAIGLLGRVRLAVATSAQALATLRTHHPPLAHSLPADAMSSADPIPQVFKATATRLGHLPTRASSAYRHRYLPLHIAVVLLAALAAVATHPTASSLDVPAGRIWSFPAFSPQPQSPPEILRAPALLPRAIQPTAGDRIPAGMEAENRELPESAATSPGNPLPGDEPGNRRTSFAYTVAPGDTVSDIAAAFGVSVDTVMLANNLSDPHSIQIGDELAILPVSGVLHTVASGDNLNDLAVMYGVSAESIAEFNGLSDPDSLVVGDKLVVPEGRILMARASPSSRGGRPAPSSGPAASGTFRWPAGGGVSQYFSGGHRAIDLAAAAGSPVYASDGGLVVAALRDPLYGRYLVIDHGNGFRSLYAHLSAFHVDQGDRVSRGETIGSVGSTGLSTGPHLHFELIKNGANVNPLNYLP